MLNTYLIIYLLSILNTIYALCIPEWTVVGAFSTTFNTTSEYIFGHYLTMTTWNAWNQPELHRASPPVSKLQNCPWTLAFRSISVCSVNISWMSSGETVLQFLMPLNQPQPQSAFFRFARNSRLWSDLSRIEQAIFVAATSVISFIFSIFAHNICWCIMQR